MSRGGGGECFGEAIARSGGGSGAVKERVRTAGRRRGGGSNSFDDVFSGIEEVGNDDGEPDVVGAAALEGRAGR